MKDKIELLSKMLDPSFDWDTYDESDEHESKEELIKGIFSVPPLEDLDGLYNEFHRVRIYRIEDTPKVLYRLLYVYGAQFPEFASDMYKTRIMWLLSEDKSLLIDVYLFKYELTFYMYTKKEAAMPQQERLDKGFYEWDVYCTEDKEAIKALETFAKTFESTFEVYMGNDFVV